MKIQRASTANNSPINPISKIYTGSMDITGSTHIPKEVREFLHLQPHSPIIYRIHGDTVELTSSPVTLEDLCGATSPLQPQQDLEDVIREAKAEHYHQRFIKKMGA